MQISPTLFVVAQVIVPLLTIAFSGVLSAIITHRLSSTRADKEFRLKRLEELFVSLDRFSQNYLVLMTPLMPVLAGRMEYPKMQEIITKHTDSEAGNHLKTVEMLIRIYFPELRPSYEWLLKARDEIAERFYGPFMDKVHRHQPFSELSKGFPEAILEFKRANDALKEQIFEVANSIRGIGFARRVKAFISDQIAS